MCCYIMSSDFVLFVSFLSKLIQFFPDSKSVTLKCQKELALFFQNSCLRADALLLAEFGEAVISLTPIYNVMKHIYRSTNLKAP